MRLQASIRNAAICALVAAAMIGGCDSSTAEALLASAKEHLSKNDSNSAIIELKNALRKSPDLPEARYLLGRVLFEKGEASVAEKEFRKALELKCPVDLVLPQLARSLMLLGKFKQVIEELGKLEITSAEGGAELKTTIGQAHLAIGETGAAEEALAAALVFQPEHVPALFGFARIAARRGDLAGALATAERAVKIWHSHADGWHIKGDILRAQGQPDAALAAYRRAVELKADHIFGHAAIVWQLAQQGRFDGAAEQLDAMKRVAPNHPQTLFLQALLDYERNDFATAREAIQRQLEKTPNNLPGMLLAWRGGIQAKVFHSG